MEHCLDTQYPFLLHGDFDVDLFDVLQIRTKNSTATIYTCIIYLEL